MNALEPTGSEPPVISAEALGKVHRQIADFKKNFKFTEVDMEMMRHSYRGRLIGLDNKMLSAWAAHHSVDPDLALLLCSSVAAHVAGPFLKFRDSFMLGGYPPPTLVGAAEDVGFHQTAMAAMESLDVIEQKLMAKSRGLSREAFDEAIRARDISTRDYIHEIDPTADNSHQVYCLLEADLALKVVPTRREALMRTRFILPGPFPAKPEQELSGYHLGAALATGAIERLPISQRARDARVNVLARSIGGVSFKNDDRQAVSRDGTGSIRGIIRFMKDDLEWMAQNRLDFMLQILPMGCLDEQMPVSFENEREYVDRFDRSRRKVLFQLLDKRRQLTACSATFADSQAAEEFMTQRAIYHAEVRTSSHLSPATVCLPDLFAWYLLQVGAGGLNEMDMVRLVFVAARNLQQRAADFYNRCTAIKQARQRLVLASRLVERMRSIDHPCKRRELARGLNVQRMDVVGPVIDSLVGIGVFAESKGLLSLCLEASGKPLRENDFMEIDSVEIDASDCRQPSIVRSRAKHRAEKNLPE